MEPRMQEGELNTKLIHSNFSARAREQVEFFTVLLTVLHLIVIFPL